MANTETTITTLDDEQHETPETKDAAPRKAAKARPSSSATTIDDDEPDDAPRVPKIAVTDHGDNMAGGKVELTLHAGEGDIGRQAVFLGINGHGFNIPRSTPVEVPEEVVQILDNATMTVYEQVGQKMHEREVKRFSYNIRPIHKNRAKGQR